MSVATGVNEVGLAAEFDGGAASRERLLAGRGLPATPSLIALFTAGFTLRKHSVTLPLARAAGSPARSGEVVLAFAMRAEKPASRGTGGSGECDRGGGSVGMRGTRLVLARDEVVLEG